MENKYYTPKLEEFHIGFEYEIKEWGKEDWHKKEIEETWEIDSAFDRAEARVKVLDKEDIESLGFDNYVPPMEYNHSWNYKGGKEPKLYVWFNNPIPIVRIYSNFPAVLFQGEIKNKSELKRLMQQLKING